MGLKGGKEERNPFVFFMLHSSLWDFEKIGYDTKAGSISFSFNHSNSVNVNCNTHILCHYDSKKLWWKEFFIYKLDFCPLSTMKTDANAASAAKVPPAPLLPTYCGHCDLDNEHKSTASLGGWGRWGGFTLAHDAIFFSGIRPLALFKLFVWSSVPSLHHWLR